MVTQQRYDMLVNLLMPWWMLQVIAVFSWDFGRQQRDAYFLGRVVILSILYAVLYPFLWVWSIIGSIWFTKAHKCLSEKNQKWGFLVWLVFSFCGLSCLAIYLVNKVLVDMIRLPDWVFESAAQEMRFIEHAATPHQPGLYFSKNQRQAVEILIQELPLFSLKAVPTDCSDCPICLEEFHVGDEVPGLPCGHNFHMACIDKWLRLNIKCPRCRCSVFPTLELNDLPNIPPDTNRSSTLTASQQVQSQPISQSYLSRMQSFLMPIRSENATPSNSSSSSSPTLTLIMILIMLWIWRKMEVKHPRIMVNTQVLSVYDDFFFGSHPGLIKKL